MIIDSVTEAHRSKRKFKTTLLKQLVPKVAYRTACYHAQQESKRLKEGKGRSPKDDDDFGCDEDWLEARAKEIFRSDPIYAKIGFLESNNEPKLNQPKLFCSYSDDVLRFLKDD